MKENLLKLIVILYQENNTMNGKKIAEALGVSTRTVRNYVNEKNRLTSNPLIQSSNNGYYIEDRRIA